MGKSARTTAADVAEKHGIPVKEITAVDDSPAGVVIKTFDGCVYVDVPESAPDADGKSGLMYLAAPMVNYTGSFPIYSQPQEDGAPVDPAVAAAEAGDPPADPLAAPAV